MGASHHHWIYNSQTVEGFVGVGAPSLARGRACSLQFLLGLASAVILGSQFRRTHVHILLSQIWDCTNLEGQILYLYPPGTERSTYTPRHWVMLLKLTLLMDPTENTYYNSSTIVVRKSAAEIKWLVSWANVKQWTSLLILLFRFSVYHVPIITQSLSILEQRSFSQCLIFNLSEINEINKTVKHHCPTARFP
jgi:hypothetical protein